MNIRRIGTAAFIATLLTGLILPAALVIAPAHAGIPVFQTCDVVAGIGAGQYNWLRPDVCPGIPSSLTLIKTLTTGDGSIFTTGAAFDVAACDSAGVGVANPGVPCLYGTAFDTSSVIVWDNTGTLIGTCGAAGFYGSAVESVNVVGGTGGVAPALVIGGGPNSHTIWTAPLPCTASSVPVAHGPVTTDQNSGTKGTDWIDTQNDKCSVNVASEGHTIASFNICTNTQNADTASGLPGINAFELRTLPGTGILVADNSLVDIVGVKSCDTAHTGGGLFSMDILPDGKAFAIGSFSDQTIDYITTAHCVAGQAGADASFDSIKGATATGLFGLAIFGEVTSVTHTTPEFGAPMMLVAAAAMMGIALVVRRKFAVPAIAA